MLKNITKSQKKKCHAIIHSHATMCGSVALPGAQIPLADNAVITPIQIAMIIELGVVFNQKISKAVAQSIISGASASLIGRGISQVLVGWIPIIGNAINTATAAGLTEAIGWMAVDRFSKEKFYDDHAENEQSDTESSNDTDENDNSDVDMEEDEYLQIKEEAQKFLNGEKNCFIDKKDYEKMIKMFEQVMRDLPAEHEMRSIYGRLCDLPLRESEM